MNQMPPFCTCLKMRAECDMRPPCKHVQDSTAVTNTQNHPPMTDLEQLKEQICGKEPVRAHFEKAAAYMTMYIKWQASVEIFDATAAAMNSKPSLNGCADIEKLAEHQYPYDSPAHYGPVAYEKHKWEVDARRQDFRIGAAAMLELVKGMVPSEKDPRKEFDPIIKISGYNLAIRDVLAAIQSLQNNDNGKDNQ